jgi:hypothetical protein
MAVSTVTGLEPADNWQLIAANTVTSGTTTSFTGLSGYRKLMVTFKGVTVNSSSWLYLRFNADSTATNYGSTSGFYANSGGNSANDLILLTGITTTGMTGYAVFNSTDKTTPKFLEDSGGSVLGYSNGIYLGTSAITAVEVFSGATYTAGSISLYGIAA